MGMYNYLLFRQGDNFQGILLKLNIHPIPKSSIFAAIIMQIMRIKKAPKGAITV